MQELPSMMVCIGLPGMSGKGHSKKSVLFGKRYSPLGLFTCRSFQMVLLSVADIVKLSSLNWFQLWSHRAGVPHADFSAGARVSPPMWLPTGHVGFSLFIS